VQVIQLALTPRTTAWHPFDLVLESWRFEGLVRHAVDLYVLTGLTELPRVDVQSSNAFAVSLVEKASDACLDSLQEAQLSAWLGRASRCNNYALTLLAACGELDEEGLGTLDCPQLEKLKVCRDLASSLVEPHGLGRELLMRLCAGGLTLDQLPSSLHQLQQSGVGAAQVAAVEHFKYTFIKRQLQSDDDKSVAIGFEALRMCINDATWVEGEIPAAVAIALTAALDRLGCVEYIDKDFDSGGDAPLFGELSEVLGAAVASDGWQAGLVTSLLQAHYAGQIRECVYLDIDEFEDRCTSFEHAVAKLGAQLRTELGNSVFGGEACTATVICHAAYARAFLQVVAYDDKLRLMMEREPRPPYEEATMRVLRNQLGGEDDGPVRRALRLQLLKEMRRSTGLERIMRLCREGYLSQQLPALRTMAGEAEDATWASVLGFDPFAQLYIDGEHTRELFNLAWEGTRRGEPIEKTPLRPRTALLLVLSAVYLPRSLKHREADLARRTLNHLLEDDPGVLAAQSPHDARLTTLCRAVASNNLGTIVPDLVADDLDLRQASTPATVFAASLVMHAAATLTPEAMATNPLARYACDPAASRQHFMIASEGNLMASIIAAIGENVTRYRCVCGETYLVADCGHTVGSGTCPNCGSTIGSTTEGAYDAHAQGQTRIDKTRIEVDSGQNVQDDPGYLKHSLESLERTELTIQRVQDSPPLSRISFRIMHLFVHLSLFASALFGNEAGLRDLIPGEQESPVLHVWRSIKIDLAMLKELLETFPFDEVIAFIHKLIEELPGWCEGRVGVLDSAALRNAWERDFAEHFIDPKLPAMQQTLRQCVDEYKRAVSVPPRLHREIDEDTTLDVALLFHPALFTITSSPSYDLLCTSFDSAPGHAQKYPFFALYLEWQPLLECVQHLWPLIRWYRMLREHYGNKLSREEAGKTEAASLLEQMSSTLLNAREIFDDFAAAWNATVSALRKGEPRIADGPSRDPKVGGRSFYDRYRETACHPVAPSAMPLMKRESSVSLCCLEEGQVQGNLLYVFVQLLVKLQNDFLDRAATLVGRTQSLRFKALDGDLIDLGREVTVSQIQESHLLLSTLQSRPGSSLQTRNVEIASSFGICQPSYGRGKSVSFSFDAIEFQLAAVLLTSALHIGKTINERREITVPAFEFAGEVLQRSLNLLSLIDEAVPQEPLDNLSTIRQSATNYLSEVKNGRALLALLEAVMFKCTMTHPSADQLVSDFCRDFDVVGFGTGEDTTFQLDNFVQNVLHDPPRVEVRLKHLRALYEEVEGKVATKLMESSPPRDLFDARFDTDWRSPDPELEGFDLVEHICARFGERVTGPAKSSEKVMAGRQRLQVALRLFIFRKLMGRSDDADEDDKRLAGYSLSLLMFDGVDIVEGFPWPKGAELTAAEAGQIDEMLPQSVQVKHAYRLLKEIQERDLHYQQGSGQGPSAPSGPRLHGGRPAGGASRKSRGLLGRF